MDYGGKFEARYQFVELVDMVDFMVAVRGLAKKAIVSVVEVKKE